ncbi:MAG TPA: SAM-dependent chlorinase/fluorinase [Candidatus Limnocylindria bacterium]|nr:SAM-dependent chlorinase/fluorinase [Candidatus Limnocylindria bacterium]
MHLQCFQRRLALLLLTLAWLSTGCGSRANNEQAAKKIAPRPTIVFMTDFGTANDSVAICKAVIINIVPDVRIMDITHQVTPFSIEEGARFLTGVTPYYPSGTVFLVVVDPGVGTSRKGIVVKSKKGQFFVLPDNGVITPVADRDGIEAAREISNPAWMVGDKVSSTFHGRDIFSPAAAHLVAGDDWTLIGPEVKDLVRLHPRTAMVELKGITAEIIGLDDPFGSLITDIQGEDFKKLGYALGEKVPLKIDKKPYTIPYVKTFMDVPVGQPLLFIDSRGRVGIALNEQDFSKVNRVSPPVPVFIPRKGA